MPFLGLNEAAMTHTLNGEKVACGIGLRDHPFAYDFVKCNWYWRCPADPMAEVIKCENRADCVDALADHLGLGTDG